MDRKLSSDQHLTERGKVMSARKLSIEIGRTINLGDFSNVKVTVGLEEDVHESVNYDDAYQGLWNVVKINLDKVTEQVLESYGSKKTTPPASERKSPNPAGSRFRTPVVEEG